MSFARPGRTGPSSPFDTALPPARKAPSIWSNADPCPDLPLAARPGQIFRPGAVKPRRHDRAGDAVGFLNNS